MLTPTKTAAWIAKSSKQRSNKSRNAAPRVDVAVKVARADNDAAADRVDVVATMVQVVLNVRNDPPPSRACLCNGTRNSEYARLVTTMVANRAFSFEFQCRRVAP